MLSRGKMTRNSETNYDVCIVGAGPGALACLSAIREPFSLDTLNPSQIHRANHSFKLHHQLKVCVIDPSGSWMHNWGKNFDNLSIEYLRSPALAHPNMFDMNALLAYAIANGREDELIESGCFGIKCLRSLGQSQIGLWKLPSNKLFYDFCKDLASSLHHDMVKGKITNIQKLEDGGNTIFKMTTDNDRVKSFVSKNVILAMGPVGRPVVPTQLLSCSRYFLWNQPEVFTSLSRTNGKKVLVVGGGLTAVQAALKVIKLDHHCVLLSRRPLIERHFDIDVKWFDSRIIDKCKTTFHYLPIEDRLASLKEVRDGGSVPPLYMRQVEEVERRQRLTRVVGEMDYLGETQSGTFNIKFGKKNTQQFDSIIIACGVENKPDMDPLICKIQEQWPVQWRGGFPVVNEELQWEDDLNLFVVGGLASLSIGPDGGNLMGIRRGAQIIANTLECRCWLRKKVLTNVFDSLYYDDSESDTESTSESDDDDAVQ